MHEMRPRYCSECSELHLICVHLVGHHVPHDVAVGLRVQGVGHHEVVGVVPLEVLHYQRVRTVASLQ